MKILKMFLDLRHEAAAGDGTHLRAPQTPGIFHSFKQGQIEYGDFFVMLYNKQ